MEDYHLFILSTMTPAITKAAVGPCFEFQLQEGTVQKFKWDKVTTIWIACQHPVINCLAESIIPYMDTCVVWYHPERVLSCLRVQNCVNFLEKYHQQISLMTTAVLAGSASATLSKVKRYYDTHGFVRKYYYEKLEVNIPTIIVDSKLSRF